MTAIKSPPDAVSSLAETSAWSPFRHPTFTVVWIATVVSNIGGWMFSAASSWLMTDLSPDPFIVSMVQVATTLPMFLLAVPAGALADIVDRRKFLIVAETADKRDANARASPSHLVPRAQQDSGSPAA